MDTEEQLLWNPSLVDANGTADNPNMDMECLFTLDDAVTALYAQLNAPSRRFAALISS